MSGCPHPARLSIASLGSEHGPPASDDDAALRWDDLDDPSYVDVDPTEADSTEISPPDTATTDPPKGLANPASLTLAVIGGVIAAAYTVAWVVGVSRLPLSGPTLLLELLYQFAEFLAIIASVLWFVTTVVLTRERPLARAGWLALGALILLPWPVVLGVIA